jgi:hypothetical protein
MNSERRADFYSPCTLSVHYTLWNALSVKVSQMVHQSEVLHHATGQSSPCELPRPNVNAVALHLYTACRISGVFSTGVTEWHTASTCVVVNT